MSLILPGRSPTGRPASVNGVRLDPSHPSAAGLLGFWVHGYDGGGTVNLVTGKRASAAGSGVAPAGGRWGPALSFSGATNARLDAGSVSTPGTLPPAFTIEVLVQVADASEGGAFVKFGADTNGWGLGVGNTTFDDDGNNVIGLREFKAWVNTGTAIGTGWAVVASTFAADSFVVYLNGVEIASGGGDLNTGSSEVFLGGYTNGSDTRYANHRQEYARVWNRALGVGELRALQRAPYELLYRPRPWWQGGLEVAAGDLTVAASAGTAVAVAGLAATVTTGATISASLGTVTAAAPAGAVLISQTVAGAVGNAVSVAALAATVVTGSTVAASVGTVTAAGQAATVDTGSGNVSIGASVATVAASALAATVATGTTSTGSAATVAAAALAASVVTGATVSASVATVTAQGRAASVTGAATLAGAVATVTAAALAASVTAGSNGVTVGAAVALATALALAGSVRIQGGFAVLQDAGPKDGADPLGFAPGDAPPALGTRSKSGMAELT